MHGFNEALKEYERYLTSPCDKGGILFDEEEYIKEKEDYKDYLGNLQYDEWREESL